MIPKPTSLALATFGAALTARAQLLCQRDRRRWLVQFVYGCASAGGLPFARTVDDNWVLKHADPAAVDAVARPVRQRPMRIRRHLSAYLPPRRRWCRRRPRRRRAAVLPPPAAPQRLPPSPLPRRRPPAPHRPRATRTVSTCPRPCRHVRRPRDPRFYRCPARQRPSAPRPSDGRDGRRSSRGRDGGDDVGWAAVTTGLVRYEVHASGVEAAETRAPRGAWCHPAHVRGPLDERPPP